MVFLSLSCNRNGAFYLPAKLWLNPFLSKLGGRLYTSWRKTAPLSMMIMGMMTKLLLSPPSATTTTAAVTTVAAILFCLYGNGLHK